MKLTKRQLSTIRMIGRWADGHCSRSKAKVTCAQLVELGLAKYKDDAIILTELGKEFK